MPQTLLSDRDSLFLSNFWCEFWKLQGSTLQMSSSYHLQTDGQTEVVNRCLEQYLHCLSFQHPKVWCDHLPWAEYWYNTSFQQAIRMTPFEAMYGRPPPTLQRYITGSTPLHDIDCDLYNRDELLKQLKGNLADAKVRMKQAADVHRCDEAFCLGN